MQMLLAVVKNPCAQNKLTKKEWLFISQGKLTEQVRTLRTVKETLNTSDCRQDEFRFSVVPPLIKPM